MSSSSSGRRRAFEEAFERDEQERERQTALQRQHMTIGARRRERRLITQRMRECAMRATLVDGAALQESLIAQGKLPFVDPISFDDGIDLHDTVLFHDNCVSKSAMLRYLDVNRDEEQVPRMFDGLPITADEMRNIFGLDPQLYRFFNPALPNVNERPVDAESEALAQQLAAEEVEENEAAAAAAAVTATVPETPDEQVLDAYVRSNVSLGEFIEVLTRGVTFRDERDNLVLYHYAADEQQTIFELLTAFVRREEVFERRGRRDVEAALLMSKVEFLLTDWRARNGNRYNIFRLGNREMIRLFMIPYPKALPVLTRLFTYVEQMRDGEAFVDWIEPVVPELRHFGFMTGVRIFARAVRLMSRTTDDQVPVLAAAAEIARWRRLVVTQDSQEFNYAKTRFETTTLERWRRGMTTLLVNINVLSFLDYFPGPIDDGGLPFVRRAAALWPMFIDPFVFEGERRFVYDAEDANLLYRLIDGPPNGDNNLKVERLLSNFRTFDAGAPRAYNISKGNFAVVSALIVNEQPAMLSLIFEVNERNARRNLSRHAYNLITRAQVEDFRSAIDLIDNDNTRARFKYLIDRYLVAPDERREPEYPPLPAAAAAARTPTMPVLVNEAGEEEDEARQIEFLEGFDDVGD